MAWLALVGVVSLGGARAWAGADYQVEYRFKGKMAGAEPNAGFTKVDGKLYGVTYAGGSARAGTIFTFDPTNGATTKVYDFKGGEDGSSPQGVLIKVGGRLYGTTALGGHYGCGTVYSFDPTKGVEKVLHPFACSPNDGSVPVAGLTDVGGELYGTTVGGGANGAGTVFSVDPANGAEKVLFSFLGTFSDSLQPEGQLIYVGGKLYGTTENGGRGTSPCSNGCGTIFSIDPATGAEALVHQFQNTDGATPEAGMIAVGGQLYGVTAFSEATANCPPGCGVVFSLDPPSGAVKVLYAFKGGADGMLPIAELYSKDNKLHGTTALGGTYGDGVVFWIVTATGEEKVQHSFRGGSGGLTPDAALMSVKGRLYGSTFDCSYGDCDHKGVIFSIWP